MLPRKHTLRLDDVDGLLHIAYLLLFLLMGGEGTLVKVVTPRAYRKPSVLSHCNEPTGETSDPPELHRR